MSEHKDNSSVYSNPQAHALSLSEILSHVLRFIPLWIKETEHWSLENYDEDDFNSYSPFKFKPNDILSYSLVSQFWREHSLQTLYFVFNYYYVKAIPLNLLKKNSLHFRIFEDTYQLDTCVFFDKSEISQTSMHCHAPIISLVKLRILNSITFENLDNILEQSPRLRHFEWSIGSSVIPFFIAQRLMNLTILKFLMLSGWELPWEELLLLLKSNSSLTRLRISSMRRNLIRQTEEVPSISDIVTRADIGLSHRLTVVQHSSICLSIVDLMLNIERSYDDAIMDLVSLCPRITCLYLFVGCLFNVDELISNLQTLRKQSTQAIPWSLYSISISVSSRYSDDYFPLIPERSLTALINCAQCQPQYQFNGGGLVKFSADISYITKELVDALIGKDTPLASPSTALSPALLLLPSMSSPMLPHISPESTYEPVLTGLELRINYTNSAFSNVKMLRVILWRCKKLKRIILDCLCDFLGPPEATLLFCEFNERGTADADEYWPCLGLQLLKCRGLKIPIDMDIVTSAVYHRSILESETFMSSLQDESMALEDNSDQQLSEHAVTGISSNVETSDEVEGVDDEVEDDDQFGYEDEEVAGSDAWDQDESIEELSDPTLGRFALQVVSQVARLPMLKVLYFNGISYTDQIPLIREKYLE